MALLSSVKSTGVCLVANDVTCLPLLLGLYYALFQVLTFVSMMIHQKSAKDRRTSVRTVADQPFSIQ